MPAAPPCRGHGRPAAHISPAHWLALRRRRGRSTNNKVFGNDTAILAFYALLVFAFVHIACATEGVPAGRVIRVICELGRARVKDGLVAGQVSTCCCACW